MTVMSMASCVLLHPVARYLQDNDIWLKPGSWLAAALLRLKCTPTAC